MRPEIEAAIIGVGAAVFVWLADWLWGLHVDRRNGKRVRAMLSIEIDENLQGLRSWRQQAEHSVSFSEGPLAGVQRGDALRKLELPVWSHRVWQASVQFVPLALDEEEIRQVHRCHQEFDELSALKGREDLKPSEASQLIKATVEKLLTSGNPLKKT